jgi:hypothetical protein
MLIKGSKTFSAAWIAEKIPEGSDTAKFAAAIAGAGTLPR